MIELTLHSALASAFVSEHIHECINLGQNTEQNRCGDRTQCGSLVVAEPVCNNAWNERSFGCGMLRGVKDKRSSAVVKIHCRLNGVDAIPHHFAVIANRKIDGNGYAQPRDN